MRVGFEVGRELEEQQTELAGLTDGLEDGEELSDVVAAIAEALEVGDALRSLEAEPEVCGRCGQPVFEHGGRGQSAEGVVDFDGSELGGVELEEALRRCGRGVKVRLPGGIGPA